MLQVHQMTKEEFNEMAEKAIAYMTKHDEHVNAMLESTELSVPPSGSDIFKPELWKPIHWRWFENWVVEQGKQFLKYFN